VEHPGKFKVSAEIAALASGQFEIIDGEQKISGTAPVTSDYVTFQRIDLTDTLDLAAGRMTLTVKPVAEGWQPMNLRSVQLLPAE